MSHRSRFRSFPSRGRLSRRLCALTLLLSVCSAAPVLAAPPTAEKTYRVEAIVFAQPGNTDEGERWSGAATLPPALETLTPAADLPAESKLLPALQALKASYRVLAQASWTQPAADKATTKPVAVRTADGTLDGTLMVYVSRFLHTEVNLRWRADAVAAVSTANGAGASPPPVAPATATAPAEPAAATPVYRLSERRRIKSAETHYFDHPKFGVLLRVTPL